jgi:cell division protein FtsL
MLPLVALGLVAVLGWALYSPLKIQYQETREQARLEAELASLQERNEGLSAQVERLKTPEGVEEVARESLGMVKPGENLYVVIDPAEEATTAVAGVPEEATVQDSLWNDLLDLVFGVR